MRRLAAIVICLAVVGAIIALASRSGGRNGSSSRIDVIFDDARGVTGGQLVKIAGAPAGTIENVVVTPDFKARIEATVDSRFVPFHQDASCTIRPQGLIAENFVECDPGTANSPPLRSSGGHPPTVPVANTTEPVSLLDLFNIFNLPTRERLTVFLNELGIATSARGEDINAILLRANPTLSLARRAITILAHQRAALIRSVDATGTLAADGATHAPALSSFLDRAAALSTLIAGHRDSVSSAIEKLPGLLSVAQPSLQQLDAVAVNGTPLLRQINVAVPALNRVASDIGPFIAVANPGLATLSSTFRRAVPAIRRSTPLINALRSYTSSSLVGTRIASDLFENLQQHGFFESFLASAYYLGTVLSRFDATSHMAPLLFIDPRKASCGVYAKVPVPGCSARYGSHHAYEPNDALAGEAASIAPAGGPPGRAAARTPIAIAAAGQAAERSAVLIRQNHQALQSLFEYLFK